MKSFRFRLRKAFRRMVKKRAPKRVWKAYKKPGLKRYTLSKGIVQKQMFTVTKVWQAVVSGAFTSSMALYMNRSTSISTGQAFYVLNDCNEFIAREALNAFRQIKWVKVRFIPFLNQQMGGVGTTSLQWSASVYGPYQNHPTVGAGYGNDQIRTTDGYKQVYGGKEHHRFVKNPAKTALKLLTVADTRFVPYQQNGTVIPDLPGMLVYFLAEHSTSSAQDKIGEFKIDFCASYKWLGHLM